MTMKRKRSSGTPEEKYTHALTLLDDTSKYLKNAGCDPNLLHTVGQILVYLRCKTNAEIHAILKSDEKARPTREEEQETDEQIASLSADQLRQKLADPTVSRKILERIAKIRFGVSSGALSTLRDKQALCDKLLTLIAHEGTHDSIAKLASGNKSSSTQ